VEKIYDYGYDIKEFYRALMQQFRNLLIRLIAPQNDLIDASDSDKDQIKRQAEMAGEEKLHLLLNFLISREEDLRFTSHPRLVLETTMVKLCRVGDILSFEELLKRMTSLENRLAGAARADGAAAAPERLSDPGAGWRSDAMEGRFAETDHPVQQDNRDLSAGGRSQGGWDDFLAHVAKKSPSAHSILRDWQVLKLTGDTLEMECRNDSFSSRYFDDLDHHNQFIEYCREFFGRDMKLNIRARRQTSPGRLKKEPESRVSKHQEKRDPVIPKTAQDVLSLFDGQMIEENLRSDKSDKRGGTIDERNA
jgi:DNA polymerase-3 subunit gamma/tau